MMNIDFKVVFKVFLYVSNERLQALSGDFRVEKYTRKYRYIPGIFLFLRS